VRHYFFVLARNRRIASHSLSALSRDLASRFKETNSLHCWQSVRYQSFLLPCCPNNSTRRLFPFGCKHGSVKKKPTMLQRFSPF
jgi:hypothetical protein